MEARKLCAAAVTCLAAFFSLGASYRTENFIVQAPTPQLAREFAETAETCRRELSIEWLGEELPRWAEPCPVRVDVGPQLGAGGATSFMFDRGRPFGWTMNIQGSRERLIDSVIPHEVTHTIFATHFGRPLPRWADEGACTSIEADVEKNKHKKMLIRFLTTGQGIAFNRMFAMTEYPSNILPLYSQGYSVARYLIAQGGKQRFVAYIGEGMQTGNWPAATRKHYGFADLSELQVTWLEWVRQGCPPLETQPQLAGALFRQAHSEQLAAAVAPAEPARPLVKQAGYQTSPQEESPRRDQLAIARPADSDSDDGSGWYSRQRDLHQSGESSHATEHGAQNAAAHTLADARGVSRSTAADEEAYRPGSTGRDTVVHQSLARQQPIGRPTQTVLEPGTGYQPLPGRGYQALPGPAATPSRSAADLGQRFDARGSRRY